MNSFSNFELSDLLSGKLRIEDKHKPQYLAECLQKLCPSLSRMNTLSLADEISRANGRAFNSSRLPIRGETLNLSFFFELWKHNYKLQGGNSDKFVFTPELQLAFKLNPRDFWEVLVRADRELGTLLKDSYIAYNLRELPKEMSLNLRLSGGAVDDKTIRRLKEKLPTGKDTVTSHELARTLLQLFEMPNPSDYEARCLAELLEKENGIKRLSSEPFSVIPKKALDRLSTKCVLEFFKNKPLASAEASALEKGVYTVTEADLILAGSQGSDVFWQSIVPDRIIRERTLNMWKLAGMDSEARRFSKGKQILIATDRALSDALYKHHSEMALIYPMCRQAGISTQEADKFMAMLFLCHDFYKDLATFNVNAATLSRLASSNARRLWDYMKTEGLKQGGVKKIGEKIETETEKLNREAREAIKNGTAVFVEKKIDSSPKIVDGKFILSAGDIELARMAGSDKMWAHLIPSHAKRKQVLDLRKELRMPLEFRQMKPQDALPLEPELYIAELKKVELTLKAGEAKAAEMEVSAENKENLKYGYYVLSEEEKEILKANGQNAEFIYKLLEAKNYRILYKLREAVKYPKNRRLPDIEVYQMFIPSQEAHDRALYDTRQMAKNIEELVGKDKIEQIKEDLILMILHRSFHEGKVVQIYEILSPFFENSLKELKPKVFASPIARRLLWEGFYRQPVFGDQKLNTYLKTLKEALKAVEDKEFAVKHEPLFQLPKVFKPNKEESTNNPSELIENSGASFTKFNSLTKAAQSQLLAFLEETKKALGDKYVPVLVNSGLRTPKDHAERVIVKEIKNTPNLYEYYRLKNPNTWESSKTVRFYNLIQNQFDRLAIEDLLIQWNISKEDEKILKTIKKDDKTSLIAASIKLMERNKINGFEGTDHRYGTAVDLDTASKYVQTITKLDNIIKSKVPLTYGGGEDRGRNNHMHITLIK